MRADIDTVVEGMASPDDGKWFTITSTANLSQEQKNAAIVQRLVAIQQYLGDRGVETTLIEEALALKGYGFNIKYTQGSYLPGKWEAEPVLYIGSSNPAKGGTNYSGVNFKEGLNYLEKHHTKPLPRGESPTPDMFEGIVEAVPDPSVGEKFIILSPVHLSLKQRQAAMVQGLKSIREYLQARGVQMEFDHTGQRLEAPGFILYYADSHTVGGGWRAEPMILDQKMVSGKMYYFGNADFVEGINLLVNTLAQKPLPRGESPTPDMFESAELFAVGSKDELSFLQKTAVIAQGLERIQAYLNARGVTTELFPDFGLLRGKGFELHYSDNAAEAPYWEASPHLIIKGSTPATYGVYSGATFSKGLKRLEQDHVTQLPRGEAPTPDMFEEIVEGELGDADDSTHFFDKIKAALKLAGIPFRDFNKPPGSPPVLIGDGVWLHDAPDGTHPYLPANWRIYLGAGTVLLGAPGSVPTLQVNSNDKHWVFRGETFTDGFGALLTRFKAELPRGEAPTADQFERALPPSLELLVSG